ncbi:hypothetical protein CH373_15510 [Leptospira perolatii]|uniref:Uncharacterized protein n=1 Tax=Leptospira perolatii TaxID=2023191 RepID=A0A2M9ZJJ3_9LEPT|nr:hypothetical protein CH360_13970 [Leptospira perolatii]PJZ72154.1 hypothetical protein CH373_15510 [Leptospira perolatii]
MKSTEKAKITGRKIDPAFFRIGDAPSTTKTQSMIMVMIVPSIELPTNCVAAALPATAMPYSAWT